MKPNHKVIILRGLPGAGKTEFRKALRDHILISMDLYWTRDGQDYSFKKEELPQAVEWMHNRFLQALERESAATRALIVVDNTHTRLWEMDFFIRAARKADWMVHIARVEERFMECVGRCSHPVPPAKMMEMRDRFEDVSSKRLSDRVSDMEEMMISGIISREKGDG